jgi:hypothetical protein
VIAVEIATEKVTTDREGVRADETGLLATETQQKHGEWQGMQ